MMVVVRGVQQGDMLAWRRVQDGHGVGPLDKTLFTPLSLLFFLLESLTRKKNLRTDDYLEATCKLEKLKKKKNRKIVRNKMKGMRGFFRGFFFRSGYCKA